MSGCITLRRAGQSGTCHAGEKPASIKFCPSDQRRPDRAY
jgi:hypothetical protein